MANESLTGLLAEKVMRWRVSPNRFSTGNRGWKPRSYFQPCDRVADAFRLLAAANADSYTLIGTKLGTCSCQVEIAGVVGRASHKSAAAAITLAVAQSVGITTEALR